ncbi:hypothetical protein LPJ73_005581, partial [Coemansia sp. RSA 2703]
MGDNSVAFLYASQTGNAETISHQLHATAVQKGHQATYHALDAYPHPATSLRTAVFVVSTTGDGDPPDNALKFWRTLRKATKGKESALQGLRYALLGLGDTNYSNFCNTAVRLEKMLAEGGAQRFYRTALADDATGLEDVVEPWIEGLWAALEKEVQGEREVEKGKTEEEEPAKNESEESVPGKVEPEKTADGAADVDGAAAAIEALSIAPAHQPIVVDYSALAELQKLSGAPKPPPSVCTLTTLETPSDINSPATLPPWHTSLATSTTCDEQHRPFIAHLGFRTRLNAAGSAKRTLLLEILPPADNTQCRAGDAINVYAPNDPNLVSALMRRLDDAPGDLPVRLATLDARLTLPSHLQRASEGLYTLRQLLTWATDVISPPRKQTLRALADCCTDAADRDRLLFLCSRQGAKQFDAVRMQYANIVDLLYAFPSCRVTAARLLDLLPPLVPRAYSVCNAGGDVWRVAFNVADYEVPAGEHVVRRRGVCTPWLEQIKPGDAVLVARRSGHFHLPANETRPVVMVGPGTGVAPFVGFLEQRAQEMQQGVVLSPAWLFFGCRSFQDRLFADHLADHLAQGTLSRLSLCFSRDAAARSLHDADVYVQDSLRRHAQELGRMLVEQRALVYVCGDARGMGPQ